MKIEFLSYYIDLNTPTYGGVKDQIKIDHPRRIYRGDRVNTSHLSFPNHISTHIDFPYHFSDNGKKLEDYPADFWYFKNVGFIISGVDDIFNHLNSLDKNIEILILKTGFGSKRKNNQYWQKQPVISSKLASILRKKFKKLRVFGFDLISLTSQLNKEEGSKAHHEFLIKNDILILEDMKLIELTKTPNRIIISPLMIRGADGVPCNVISINEK